MTMSSPPSINYAEQVLREEAERLAQIKENSSSKISAAAVNAKKDETGRFAASIAKVNLNDEDDFPTLGKAKGTVVTINFINYYILL